MKFKFVNKVRAELWLRARRLELWALEKSAPLTKGWLKRNDPWGIPQGTLRWKIANHFWCLMSGKMFEDVVFSSAFERPVEWNCDKQVAIEARIHGLPLVDPEGPFIEEPERAVLDPNGKHFKVVMKRRPPVPVIPAPSRAARKRKARKTA